MPELFLSVLILEQPPQSGPEIGSVAMGGVEAHPVGQCFPVTEDEPRGQDQAIAEGGAGQHAGIEPPGQFHPKGKPPR